MKKIVSILVLALAATCSFAQKSKSDTLVVQTKIYCDHCQECESCKPHIERYLGFEKGIKSAAVNTQSQTITVIYNPKKTNPLAIKKAIAEAGYDADDFIAVPKAMAKLDDCCKKQ